MHERPRTRLLIFGLAILAPAITLLVRWPLDAVLGDRVLYMAFFPAILIVAYIGGFWPGLLTTVVSALAADYYLVEPLYSLEISSIHEAVALSLLLLVGTMISGLSEAVHRSRRRLVANERRYAVTLSSIGDAVIATDNRARVTFMNPVAEALTGWPQEDAAGRPLAEVFRIVNEETRQPVDDPAAKVLRLGAVVGLANHTALISRDGREVLIDDSGAPIIDDRLAVIGVVLVFRDTTQRRKSEEAEVLRRANDRMELAVRGSKIAIWELDMPDGLVEKGRVTLVNALEPLGHDAAVAPTDVAGVFALSVHPEDQAWVGRAVQACLAGEPRELDVEHRTLHKDGSIRWHLTRGTVLCDPKGIPIRFIGSRVDITDVKRAEEALRKSEQRFRTFVDHATDAFLLFDDELVVLDVNRQACQRLGYTRDELIGMTPLDFDPDVTPGDLEENKRKLDEGELMAFESRHRRKDGTVFPVEVRGQAFSEGGRRFIVSLVRDDTERKRAEKALRESEQRWRSLTEALPQLVWSATPNGACDYFSTQWTQHTGVPESDLLGWRWMETLHPDDREPTRKIWTNSVAGRGAYDVEYRIRRSDGEYRWFKTRGVPIPDSGGNVFKWFGTCTDITDLRRTEEALRESEERFRGTFENAGVGIAHTHPTGRLLRVNEKFCAIVGYPRAELLQKTFQDITHPEDLTVSVGSLATVMRGESAVVGHEKRYIRKDGSPVWVELFTSLQRNAAGQSSYAIAVIHDISERRRLDSELRRAKELAEAANHAKDEFLANVSHEIRTPMNAILGMTELALDTPLTEDQRQCLKTVKSAADNLLGIINDLLDFSKIEAGKLELDPADFSLRAALGDTLRALAVRAHRKGLELVCHIHSDVPDALVGDAGRLRQILLNLVSNAIKFTDDGEVVVQVKTEDRGQRTEDSETEPTSSSSVLCPLSSVLLHFAVRDTGIGISQDRQDKIFRAFEQEDTSTTRKYGGTGLGLTIAARLVALMGGQITLDSEPRRGSTFTFTARFGRQPHPPEPLSARPPVLLQNLPVLVVDDNATNRRILEEWLRGWQLKPEAVADGLAALEALWDAVTRGQPYPLVLLDGRMPDTDGLTLAAKIRKRAELSTTRIVLLTSGDRPGDLGQSREARIDAHLLKPVQREELLETIYRVMSRTDGAMASGESSAAAPPLTTRHSPFTTALRILVAEDNEFNTRHLEQLLALRGHTVTLASNGREAIALLGTEDRGQRTEDSSLESQPGEPFTRADSSPSSVLCPLSSDFDLMLLDLHMPELDGFQVIRAIREREQIAGGHLPVIALTARSRKEDRDRCLAAGMDDYLAKPLRAADLFSAIDRVISAQNVPELGKMKIEDSAGLLDPVVLLAACGDDAEALRARCLDLRAYLPGRLVEVVDALHASDAPRLREAAHKLCGVLSVFSTTAAAVAMNLEDRAAVGRLEESLRLVKQLETMAQELLRLVDGLSIKTLRHQAGAAGRL
jgi:two-component system sensor histidine kinase/response regulator